MQRTAQGPAIDQHRRAKCCVDRRRKASLAATFTGHPPWVSFAKTLAIMG